MKNTFLSRPACSTLLLAAFALGSAQAGAAQSQLIQNGGFEADSDISYAPTGWSVADPKGGFSGSVAAANAALAASSGYATAGAAAGNYFGHIDVFTEGAFGLSQSFSTGAVSQATLSFKMFINDQSLDGIAYTGNSLNYNRDTNGGLDMHYARVDILKAGADAFATGSDVVQTLYLGGATGRKFGDQSNTYVSYSYDLSNTLAAGGNYTLRFAAASNIDHMQLGVDNVSLQVTAVPEPESYAMLLAGLGLIGAISRRRNRA